MTDAFEAIIGTLVSDKSLRNEIRTWVNQLSILQAFKVHLKIAFYFFAFRHKIKNAKYYFDSKELALNMHVKILDKSA